MASRLDTFFDIVFDQLKRQGQSYRTVCGYLLVEGVEISPQALRSWYLRRNRKIAARSMQAVAPQGAGTPGHSVGTLLPTSPSLPHEVRSSETAVQPSSFTADSDKNRSLIEHIKDEEQKFALLKSQAQARYSACFRPETDTDQ